MQDHSFEAECKKLGKQGCIDKAKAHLQKSEFAEAVRYYHHLLSEDPKEYLAWKECGRAKYKLHRYEEAIKDFGEAIKLNPQDDEAWQLRGSAKRIQRHYVAAIQDLGKSTKLNPKNESAKQELEKIKELLKNAKNNSPSPVKPSTPETSKLNESTSDSSVFSHTINFSMTIPKEQLNLDKRLGEGSFGEVHQGLWKPTSLYTVVVAVKQLKNFAVSQKVLEDFKREVEIQSKLDSSGVVKLFGITSEQPYCMVMEFMEKGTLRDVLHSQKPLELHWDIRLHIAGNMARGLAYLHGQNPVIIHGDLKSLNVLINGKGEAKLADFGLAALKTGNRSKEYIERNDSKNKGPRGSLRWMAPELFTLNGGQTTATDVYSFAIVLWELASHMFPYEEAAGNLGLIREWVMQGKREVFDERTPNTPKEYSELTQSCWEGNEKKRPTAEEIVTHLEKLYSRAPLVLTLFSSGSSKVLSLPFGKPETVSCLENTIHDSNACLANSELSSSDADAGNRYK